MTRTAEEIAVARRRSRERRIADERERAEQTRAYNESRRKGYVPSRETLEVQLEELYADAKISIQQYEWGMKGLDVVHSMVGGAGALELTQDEGM